MYRSIEPFHFFKNGFPPCAGRCLRVLGTIACLLHVPQVFAQVETSGLGAGYAVKTIVSLILVLLAIAVLIVVLKRLQGFSVASHADMKILSSMPVGPREKIMLVKVGEEQLLLGVTSASVQLIKVLDKPLPMGGENPGESSSSPRFSTHLNKLLNR